MATFLVTSLISLMLEASDIVEAGNSITPSLV